MLHMLPVEIGESCYSEYKVSFSVWLTTSTNTMLSNIMNNETKRPRCVFLKRQQKVLLKYI